MYQICPLPYSYEKLEPFIDTHTLGLHYQKHQKGYLKKLNELITGTEKNFHYPLEILSYHIEEFPESLREDILFNLGGVLNHTIYFRSMSENKKKPSEILKQEIENEFQNLENFKQKFKESALKVKGSGYTFLILDKEKKLKIINTFNQDSPYFHRQIPLLCIDLWEHAYYINYENKRDLYIDNFFEVMDFTFPNQIYQKITNSKYEQNT